MEYDCFKLGLQFVFLCLLDVGACIFLENDPIEILDKSFESTQDVNNIVLK